MKNDKVIAAEILVKRISEKFFLNDPIDLEVNGLFYWLLGRLDREIERYYCAEDEYHISIIEGENSIGKLRLEDSAYCESKDRYYPRYVENDDDFEVVMKKVVDLFNGMPNYKAVYKSKDKYYAFGGFRLYLCVKK
ncbi:MAG: hypothetical protein IJE05_05370 [Clostridia bacterium]|nr:hypothetical protein [Clostridia bacterium]